LKTALITGITGQDGSYLAELLLEKGYRVVGLKRRTSNIHTPNIDHLFKHPNFEVRYFSLEDASSIYRLLDEYQPDEIYNLAAQSHVRVSFETPEETVSGIVLGTTRLLEAARLIVPNVKFYQASSSEMFGANTEVPQSETTRFEPASPYACAKLFGHNMMRHYRERGMFACSGILFNHESPRRGENFVTRKISRAAARIKMGLQTELKLGNLDAKRDWGFAGDYVEAMWLMLQHDTPDDYVIATGETYSVKEYLEKTFEIARLDVDKYVSIDERLFRPEEVPLLLGDPTKAKAVLGWEPKVKFDQLVRMMFEAEFYGDSFNGSGDPDDE
jgi:GDPmannose 4,6-dehydratase